MLITVCCIICNYLELNVNKICLDHLNLKIGLLIFSYVIVNFSIHLMDLSQFWSRNLFSNYPNTINCLIPRQFIYIKVMPLTEISLSRLTISNKQQRWESALNEVNFLFRNELFAQRWSTGDLSPTPTLESLGCHGNPVVPSTNGGAASNLSVDILSKTNVSHFSYHTAASFAGIVGYMYYTQLYPVLRLGGFKRKFI